MLLNRALKNGTFNLISQIVNLVLGLLFAGMTIRYLGNAQAGFFLVASAILGWTQLAGGGAFRAPSVQRLSFLYSEKQNIKADDVLRTLLSANIIVALPFAVATIFSFPILFKWSQLDLILENDAWIVILLGTIGFLLEQWSSGLKVVYAAQQRFEFVALSSLVFGLFGNLARLYVLDKYHNMPSLAIVNLVISFAWLLFDYALVNNLIGNIVIPGWKWQELRPMVSFGLWSWIGEVSGVVYYNLSSLVVTSYLGSAVLPFLALPQRIVNQVHQFLAGVSYFLFPTLAGQGKNAEHTIIRIEDRLRWFFSVSSFAIYISIFLCGPLLFTFLVNKNFSEHAMTPLLLYCIWGIASGQMLVYLFSTLALGNAKANTITDLIVSLLTFGTTFLLIPEFGYVGLCVAQLWKIPGVVWHTLWGRKILKLKLSVKDIVSPYLSSIIGATIWITLSYAVSDIFSSHLIYELVFWSFGFAVYIIIIWLLETRLFSHPERLSILKKVYLVLIERIKVTRIKT